MIKLYQFEPVWGIPNASPFRMKIETYLRMTALPYEMAGHGIASHAAGDIYEIGKDDIRALPGYLANKLFFMGERPTSLDATAYAFLANILWVPLSIAAQAICAKSGESTRVLRAHAKALL